MRIGEDWDWNWRRDALEDEMPMQHRLSRIRGAMSRPEGPLAAEALRKTMNWLGAWKHCGRKACRRAKTCRSDVVECGWRRLPWLQRDVFPALRRALGMGPSMMSPGAPMTAASALAQRPRDAAGAGRSLAEKRKSARGPGAKRGAAHAPASKN
jgi:hypothetical protein